MLGKSESVPGIFAFKIKKSLTFRLNFPRLFGTFIFRSGIGAFPALIFGHNSFLFYILFGGDEQSERGNLKAKEL